jgi:CRP/FNR family transcriptional regulator, cyclic AMP receptor protein
MRSPEGVADHRLRASDDGSPGTMPHSLQDEFARRAQVNKTRKGQIIIAEGTDNKDVFLIQSGQFRVFLYSSQGREVILRDIGAGHLIGEMSAIDDQPRSCSVMALGEAQVARISGTDFLRFLGEVPQAGLWMTRQLSDRIRDLTTRSFDLVTLPVGSRVQRELLRLAEEQHPHNASDMCLLSSMPTHADIAARIGSHREAVSREIGQLIEEGIVRKHGRTLEIRSISALHALQERMRK